MQTGLKILYKFSYENIIFLELQIITVVFLDWSKNFG